MSRRSTRRKAAQQRSNRSSHSRFSIGRRLHRLLRLEPLEDRHLLAITVTTLADTVDLNNGLTSLREAIFAANTVPGADTIDFAPSLTAPGPATILLTRGELKITDSLTINGPGAERLSISSGVGDRILNVDDGFDEDCEVRLIGLTFEGTDVGQLDGGVIFNREDLTLSECVVENGSTNSYGGGIYSTSGDVSLLHTTIRNNLALDSGGGVFLVDGTLEIADSIISGNRAPNFRGGGLALYNSDTSIARTTFVENEAYAGGGLFHQDGRLQVVESQITGNTAWGGGGMRIVRSEVEVTDSTFVGNHAKYGEGGGIRAFQTTLTITESLFEGNSGRDGGGLWSYDSRTSIAGSNFAQNSSSFRGGAVSAYRETLTIQDTAIVDNSCDGYGGGVAASSAIATFLRCTIVGNDAGAGGGIFGGGMLTIADTVVRNNSASTSHVAFGGGGGVWCSSGELLIDRSDISDNRTEFNGGGIYIHDGSLELNQSLVSGNESKNHGGGIYTRFAHFAAKNTTVSGNRADVLGGGIYAGVAGHEASLQFTTISSNVSGEGAGGIYLLDGYLKLSHSIVASNAAPSGPDLERFFVATFVPHHSIVGDASLVPLGETPNRIPDANGNLIGGPVNGVIDPQLGPLADNGGFELPDGSRILTHALLPGSPAINAGDLNAAAGEGDVPQFDQRGEPFGRIVGGRIDIGAFEYQTPTDLNLLVDTLADESDGDYSRGDLSLREAIELANQNRYAGVTDTVHFDPALTADGPATILLTRGELKITDSLTINGPGADLLTIDASGNDPTPNSTPHDNNFRDDADGSRIFNIDDGLFRNLTTNSIAGLRLTGGDRRFNGGAIYCLENLALNSVVITGNTAIGDGSGSGGGIFIGTRENNPQPQLTVTNSVFSDNYASGDGGGIAAQYATIRVSASSLEQNHSRSGGGAIGVWRGSLSIEGALLRTNKGGNGGAIRSDGGTSTIENCEILENEARNGGGIYAIGSLLVRDTKLAQNQAYDGNGGAILGSNARVEACEIYENFASNNGGGLHVSGTVKQSALYYNTSKGSGGGIFGSQLQVSNCVLAGNLAYGDGGAIASDSSNLEIVGSSLYGNTADHGGGGVFRDSAYSSGELKIHSTTIAGNNSRFGGGLYVRSNAVSPSRIEHSTIVQNYAGVGGGVYLLGDNNFVSHSIIGENLANLGPDLTGLIGTEFELAYSLVWDNSNSGLAEAPIGAPDSYGNLIGGPIHGLVDLLLQSVSYGPTPDLPFGTYVVVPTASSPVVNAGDPSAVAGQDGVPTHDQRGAPFTRVYGGRIDIGAVESIPDGLLPGDYIVDGVVDARDYTAWRDSVSAIVSPGSGADGNGDGVVDQQDYAVWKRNFGATMFQLGAGSREQGVKANAIAEDELSSATPDPLVQPRKLAPTLVHAPQRPALSGVLNGLDRNQSPTFSPRDRALAAWFASRRSTALTDSQTDVENNAHNSRPDVTNSIDAALATLDDDRDFPRRRALHVLH